MREPIRVLLLETPHLLRGILEHEILVRSGFELLKETRGVYQMLTEERLPPDVVILGLRAAEDATLVPALFARWPRAQVMTVTQAGNDVAVYELRPRQRVLGQMSPTEILEALQEAVHGSHANNQE
jgi:DNA-binding NarL/FixJ family response regulator